MEDNSRDSKTSSAGTFQTGPERDESEHQGDQSHTKLLGPDLIHHLFTASKTIQVHQLNNRAVQRVLSELAEIVRSLIQQEGRAALRVSAGFLYINGVRISVDPQGYGPFLYLIDEMKKRRVESLEFHPGFDEEELGRFLKMFYEVDESEDAFDQLTERMRDEDIRNLEVSPWVERERHLRDAKTPAKDVRAESNKVFFRTVRLMKEVLHAIEEKHVIQVKKAKRLTQQMTDIIKTDEAILLGLTSIKHFDEYTFAHSVNVCILSMLTGDRLRLYKQDVARLGLAALFHDIGKVHIPSAILRSTTTLSDREWELMKYHTFFGMKELSRVKALREVSDAMFVALQHHIHYDMNGYPQKPGGWDLPLFARIVTVADYYDAMTSPRSYRKIPVTPDKALRFILMKSGKIFDPLIVKVFIQAMGIYPIGTIVELDTGEKAVVIKQNAECRYIHRPTVQILTSSSSEPAPESPGPLVDLTERSAGEYRFRRSIVRALYDEEAGIDKRGCFVAV